ncbi:MAG: hypothetical protein AAB870_00355 [Patescibacteria group bacterium]
MRTLFKKNELDAAIGYFNDFKSGIRSYAAVMDSPLAYVFLAEYAPIELLKDRFSKDECFKMYIRCLLDKCQRSFERDSFPLNYNWKDFWDEKDDDIYYKMEWVARHGGWSCIENGTRTVISTAQAVSDVNYFYEHSTLFREMIFETLFGIRPQLEENITIDTITFERAAKKMYDLLKGYGCCFYELGEKEEFLNFIKKHEM